MAYTEQDIIEGLREGKDWAYAYIFDQYYEGMCVMANTILHDSFLAEATAQDVISHVYELREQLVIRTNLRAYLYTSVRNTCLNALGTKLARTEYAFSSLGDDDVTDVMRGIENTTPQGVLLDKEMHSLVMDFINELPEPARSTFMRARFDGKSYREIGREQGVSANTVKYHIKKVMAMLEERFGKYLTCLVMATSIFAQLITEQLL